FALYRGYGFGSAASGAYLDPLRDAPAFWSAVAPRYAELVRIQLGAPSTFIDVFPKPAFVVLDVVGIWFVLLTLLVLIVRGITSDREIGFWLTCASLGFLPLVSAVPHDRLLVHVGIAVWMLVGMCAASMWRWASSRRTTCAMLVSVLALVPAMSYAVASPIALVLDAGQHDKSVFAGSMLNDDASLSQRSLIIVTGRPM
ncbi:MAG TPA: hypothetical protein VFN67_17080, partial [Polyangiales bacterium]|nr:hypothetical protein [Polyangiales bacterium]